MRRKLALTAAISMAVGLAGCTKIKARDLIREGNELYRGGNWVGAIEKYDESLDLEPDGVTVLWNRAMAAEARVLELKDAVEEDKVAERNQYAAIAIESLDAWNELRAKSGVQDDTPECAKSKAEAPAGEEAGEEEDERDPDLVAYQQHRLAILGADSRCSELVEHWRQLHQACPSNEDLYQTIAQTFEDICGKPEEADKWFIKRTEDFPDSPKAWYSLATRRFYPLMPDPESGLPFNAAIDATTRTEIADEVIRLLAKASELDPKYRDPFVWRSMAYTQKSLAREYIDPPMSPEDSIEAILARRDLMLAWRETKAVCDLDKIPDCPLAVEPGVLFVELEVDGSSWKDREINLTGNVVNGSVKEIDKAKLIYEFDLEVEFEPPVAEPEDGAPPEAPEGEGEGEGEDEANTRLVKIRYTFQQPYAEEGQEPPDISGHVSETLAKWERLKSVSFDGFVTAKGADLVLESVQKEMLGCCPPAPLTPEEEKSDNTRLDELGAEIKARDEAAAAEEAKKNKKGKGR